MKTYFIALIMSILCIDVLIAQTSDYRELGHAKPQELAMTVYAPDSSAEAVVLEDRGTTYLTHDNVTGYYHIDYHRYRRIKILKKSGIDYANVTIPFYHFGTNANEVLTKIAGRTYNESGFKEIGKDAIFEEKKSEKYSLKKITFPDVREGSIIEYVYTLRSDLVFELRDWEFQREIPTLKSDYVLHLIPGFEYRILFQNMTNKLKVDDNNLTVDGANYHWAADSIEALKKEPYTTTIEDYRSKIYFELIATNLSGSGYRTYTKSWDDLDKTLISSPSFGGVINKMGFLKDSIEVIKHKATDTLGRIQAVYDFVRRNMNYDNRQTMYVDKTLKDAYQKHSGSVAEINLLIVAILRELGLPANPVILSTRSNGQFSKEYPLLSRFNYVIAHIDLNGTDLLLDATDKFLKMGLIPFECLNDEGRLIARNPRWIKLKASEKHSQVYNLSLQMMPNGQLKGRFVQNCAGYAAADIRKKIFEIGEERYKEQLMGKNSDWQISNLSIENTTNTNESLQITMDALIGDANSSNRIYLNSMMSGRVQDNPFKKANRSFPVDFGMLQEQVYIGTIVLPDNYVVEELPKNETFAMPNNAGRLIYAVQAEQNTIKINSRFTINKIIVEPKNYGTLRAFYDKTIAKQAELIVLKKK